MNLQRIKELQEKLENIGGQGIDFSECYNIAEAALKALQALHCSSERPMLAVGDVLDAGTRNERIIVGISGSYYYFVRPSDFHNVRQWPIGKPHGKEDFTTVHRPSLIWTAEEEGETS